MNVIEAFAVNVGECKRRLHVACVENLVVVGRVSNKANENRLIIVIHRVTVRENVLVSKTELGTDNLSGDRY